MSLFPILKKTERNFLIVFLFLLFLVIFLRKDLGNFAGAAGGNSSTQYLSGYAWSSNIGWISLNCNNDNSCGASNYYVTKNSDGTLTGYAWSNNVGWINFGCGQGGACSENGGVPSYPTGGGTTASGAYLDTTGASPKLIGFVRACSVFVSGCSGSLTDLLSNGGWDGWISLNGDNYSITFDGSNSALQSSYAWGGGNDVAIGGLTNSSPQVPGWISFAGSTSDGRNYGVKMCDAVDCGTAGAALTQCTVTPYPAVGVDVVWDVANKNPAYTYKWTITPPSDITINDYLTTPVGTVTPPNSNITVVNSSPMTVRYSKPGTGGPWTTDVTVTDGSGTVVGHCENALGQPDTNTTQYVPGDKGFYITSDGPMTAQFIRSVKAATFPDVTLSITPYGGFSGDVTIRFTNILGPANTGRAIKGDSSNTYQMIVEPQFWNTTSPTPASTITLHQKSDGTYETANLRLNLTKNSASQDQTPLVSSSDYQVVVDSVNGGSPYPIPLTINNPSGGIKER